MLSAAVVIGASKVNRMMVERSTLITAYNVCHLTFTSLLANTADDKLVIFFLFFPENRIFYTNCL